MSVSSQRLLFKEQAFDQTQSLFASQPLFFKEQAFEHAILAKVVAEFVGTFFLVFTVGCNVHTASIGAAISIGGILMVMVYSLGPVSGAHLNPAVTFAIGLSGRGKISLEHMCYYILAQLAGGIVGAFHYWIIFQDAFLLRPAAGYSHHDAACSEILFTMALCYVVLNVATTENQEQGNVTANAKVPNSFYGLAIGLTVTSAAVAVGPISGCSLNPAVSVGSLLASKLAKGEMPLSSLGLYTLAPLFGASLATLFFYFVQGGLSGQFEYGDKECLPLALPCPQPFAPVSIPRGFQFLKNGELFYIPKEMETHTLSFGIGWKLEKGYTSMDIDASCVKFTSEGRFIEGIYFDNQQGKEDRKGGQSVIFHRGDNATGKGDGFGFTEEHVHRTRDGQPPPIKDDEQIEIKQLAKLRQFQPRCTYMFFVINIFSAARKFEVVKEMSIRIFDKDLGLEACRFEKKDLLNNKFNGFVLGVLFWHKQTESWIFQIVDNTLDIKEHGTYREFEPKLKKIVRQMEGLDP